MPIAANARLLVSMRDERIHLDVRTPFTTELRRRVDAYFVDNGIDRDGGGRMVRKALFIFTWMMGSWAAFVWGGFSLPVNALLAASMGFAMAGIGMAVQHDGGHAAFAGTKRGNRLSALSLDFLGASSYVWKVKHAHIHHTYPNIVGTDDDISLEPLARMAPGQPRHWFHRFQHLYMWVLYGFIGLKWWVWDDYAQVASGKIGERKLNRPKGSEAFIFYGGKIIHGVWALLIPGLVVGWVPAIAFYVGAQLVMGVTLAVVFQLAHCVEEATFVVPELYGGPLELDFSAHQLETTVDFSQGNKLISWYVGGLNYQVEHHLFPRVCHLHYPAIAPIIEQCCQDFGVPYKVAPSLGSALRSHYRWLRRLGREDLTENIARAPEAAMAEAA